MPIDSKKFGFTLAEVLIALALLGVVAAFAIPKVLQAVEDQKKKAIFKETVGMVSEVISQTYLKGEGTTGVGDILTTKLNALSATPPILGADGIMVYRFTLKNGAFLQYRDGSSPDQEAFLIDYNGLGQGPDQLGEDRVNFWGNLTSVPCCCGIKPGGVGVVNPQVCAPDQPPWTSASITTQEFYDAFNNMVVK